MAKTYIRWCDLCGLDFKALSPFAKMCPQCKSVKFKKPGYEHRPVNTQSRRLVLQPAK